MTCARALPDARCAAQDNTQVGWFYPGSGASEGWPVEEETSLPRADYTLRAPGVACDTHDNVASVQLQMPAVPERLWESKVSTPAIMNVALPANLPVRQVRRILTRYIFPKMAAFAPDLILVSAGFDGHVREAINCGYASLCEDDYTWMTRALVKISNASCPGRIVSVLEGGYRVHGAPVSAFGRSVAAHVA
ncbi:hypothetical protein EON67_06795, partial [archaeon]